MASPALGLSPINPETPHGSPKPAIPAITETTPQANPFHESDNSEEKLKAFCAQREAKFSASQALDKPLPSQDSPAVTEGTKRVDPQDNPEANRPAVTVYEPEFTPHQRPYRIYEQGNIYAIRRIPNDDPKSLKSFQDAEAADILVDRLVAESYAIPLARPPRVSRTTGRGFFLAWKAAADRGEEYFGPNMNLGWDTLDSEDKGVNELHDAAPAPARGQQQREDDTTLTGGGTGSEDHPQSPSAIPPLVGPRQRQTGDEGSKLPPIAPPTKTGRPSLPSGACRNQEKLSEKQPDNITAASPATSLPASRSALPEAMPAVSTQTRHNPDPDGVAAEFVEERKMAIASMMDMGFPFTQVEVAMQAAQGNQDLAIEYLCNVSLEVLNTVMSCPSPFCTERLMSSVGSS